MLVSSPDHYNSRQIEPNRVDACMLFFGGSANRPAEQHVHT